LEFRVYAARLKPELRTHGTIPVLIRVIALK
jgi:hypothetical protein